MRRYNDDQEEERELELLQRRLRELQIQSENTQAEITAIRQRRRDRVRLDPRIALADTNELHRGGRNNNVPRQRRNEWNHRDHAGHLLQLGDTVHFITTL